MPHILQADAGNLIWLFIAIFVIISKVVSHLKGNAESDDQPVEPPPPRPVRPRPQPRPAVKPPVMPRTEPRRWTVAGKELEEFLGRVQRPSAPATPLPVAQPVAPPKLASAPAPIPATAKTPPPAPAPVASPSRSAQWTTALRDKQNVRNIIISAEIIGPPKAAQM